MTDPLPAPHQEREPRMYRDHLFVGVSFNRYCDYCGVSVMSSMSAVSCEKAPAFVIPTRHVLACTCAPSLAVYDPRCVSDNRASQGARVHPPEEREPEYAFESPPLVADGELGGTLRVSLPLAADGGVERCDDSFSQAVRAEVEHAFRKHGRDPWGRHEFYAVLKEEVDELWDAIKSDAPTEDVLAESVQVAAMCLRYALTGDRYRGAHPAIPLRTALLSSRHPGDSP